MKRPVVPILWACVLTLGGSACGRSDQTDAATVTVTAGGASISMTATPHGDQTLVTVQIIPRERDLHLYDIDLVPGTVGGLGTPTEIELIGGWTATARPSADRPVQRLDYEPLQLSLPVYPNGAVTFTIPANRTSGRVGALVSFGLCSESHCLPPVRDLHIEMSPVDSGEHATGGFEHTPAPRIATAHSTLARVAPTGGRLPR